MSGLRRARAHSHADFRSRQIDPAAREDLALFDEVVERGTDHDHHVEQALRGSIDSGIASGVLPIEGPEAGGDAVAGGGLEFRCKDSKRRGGILPRSSTLTSAASVAPAKKEQARGEGARSPLGQTNAVSPVAVQRETKWSAR